MRRHREINRVIYKEPFFSFCPEFTFELLPNIKIIYIYRDGRDCANSLVQSYDILSDEKLKSLTSAECHMGREYGDNFIPWWVELGQEAQFYQSTPFVRAIWMWKVMIQRSELFLKSLTLDQLNKQVFKIKYETFVEKPMETGSNLASFLNEKLSHRMKNYLLKANQSSIGKYKKRTFKEIQEAEEIAKVELSELGYPCG